MLFLVHDNDDFEAKIEEALNQENTIALRSKLIEVCIVKGNPYGYIANTVLLDNAVSFLEKQGYKVNFNSQDIENPKSFVCRSRLAS